MPDLGHLDTARGQLGPRRLDVGHHKLQTLHRAGRHLGEPGADGYRARGPWRRELYHAEGLAHAHVVVDDEAGLLAVELLRAVYVGDRENHDLELPVHAVPSFRAAPWRAAGSGGRREVDESEVVEAARRPPRDRSTSPVTTS